MGAYFVRANPAQNCRIFSREIVFPRDFSLLRQSFSLQGRWKRWFFGKYHFPRVKEKLEVFKIFTLVPFCQCKKKKKHWNNIIEAKKLQKYNNNCWFFIQTNSRIMVEKIFMRFQRKFRFVGSVEMTRNLGTNIRVLLLVIFTLFCKVVYRKKTVSCGLLYSS